MKRWKSSSFTAFLNETQNSRSSAWSFASQDPFTDA